MKRLCAPVLIVVALLFSPLRALAGPFGFEYGMSREQVRKLVGDQAMGKSNDLGLELNTAPKPLEGIETYVLYFSPSKGLLKIEAVGQDIHTNSDGSAVRTAFSRLQVALMLDYGAPYKTFDFIKAESAWTEPRHFMMSLIKNDRALDCYWLFTDRTDHIHLVDLAAQPLGLEKGYLRLTYEFDGWEAFVEETNAKTSAVL